LPSDCCCQTDASLDDADGKSASAFQFGLYLRRAVFGYLIQATRHVGVSIDKADAWWRVCITSAANAYSTLTDLP
jgi:hypothetical protein